MELDTDVETARQVLEEAFLKLELRRLAAERSERLADYEREPSEDRLQAYRAADRSYTEARARSADTSSR